MLQGMLIPHSKTEESPQLQVGRSFARLANVKYLDTHNFCKCVNSAYAASLVHGMAGFPFDNSLAAKVQSMVGRIGLGAVRLRVSQAPSIQVAHLRRSREFKELKRAGAMKNPLLLIGAQRMTLLSPPTYLRSVFEYRTLEWSRTLSLNSRPARTRGGIILDLGAQLLRETEDFSKSKHFATRAWSIRYGGSGLWT